MKEFKH
jgi:hypothetical protein